LNAIMAYDDWKTREPEPNAVDTIRPVSADGPPKILLITRRPSDAVVCPVWATRDFERSSLQIRKTSPYKLFYFGFGNSYTL